MSDNVHSGQTLQELHMPFMITTATPEDSLTGEVDDFAYDKTASIFYRKDTGVGNTGWEIWRLAELYGDLRLYEADNDGNPELRIGAADAEELHIQTVYDSGAQTLDYVLFKTDVASGTADKGQFKFNVGGVDIFAIDDNGIEIYIAVNDANPTINLGSSSAETFTITTSYVGGGQLLEFVEFKTTEASGTADLGEFRFSVDGSLILTIDDGGLELKDGALIGTTTTVNAITIEADGDIILVSDLYLASGNKIDFDSGNFTVTHTADLLTFAGDGVTFTDATANKPLLLLENTTNDATAPIIRLENDRGAAGVDADAAGSIMFNAGDADQTQVDVVQILGFIEETAAADQAGRLTIKILHDDGSINLDNFLDMSGDNGTPGQGFIEFNADQKDIDFEVNYASGSAFTIDGNTGATDVVGDFTAGTIAADTTISGTTITASIGFALDDGDYVGVTGNERLVFNTAGTIVVTAAILQVDDIQDDGNDATLSFSGTGGIDVVNALTAGTIASDADLTAGADLIVNGAMKYGSATSLTITAGGAVAITTSYHTIVVNGGTNGGNDDLTTATGGAEGDLLILKPATSGGSDTVTVKDGTGANTFILAGTDFAMNHIDDRLICIHNGTEWVELSRSENS